MPPRTTNAKRLAELDAKDIRWETRRNFSAEDNDPDVLNGLRGDELVAIPQPTEGWGSDGRTWHYDPFTILGLRVLRV